MAKIQFRLTQEEKKMEEHIGSWFPKRPGWIQVQLDPAFQCIMRTQSLSIFQLYFYPLAGISHVVAEVIMAAPGFCSTS